MKGTVDFAVLEAIRLRMEEEGISFEQAVPRVSREVVFTTHTPVPAGHDRFDAALVEEHLGPLRESLGLSRESFHGARPRESQQSRRAFCMTVLGLRLSRRANAVSSLHGEVSRAMWTGLSPGKPKTPFPSDTSPTACTFPPGSLRRCFASTIAIWERAGTSAAASQGSGKELTTSTTANSGRLT